MRRATPSLRRELGLRLAAAGGAALLALALVLGTIYSVQHRRLEQDWLRDAQRYFDRQTRRLDADWLRQAELLRTQLEFSGVFDTPDDRLAAARFTALMTSMAGQGTFTHVLVHPAQGGTWLSYVTRSAAMAQPVDRAPLSWAHSEADALAYRVLRMPLQLGPRGRGELVLMVPINRALLSSIAFPDTRISLQWLNDKHLAESAAVGGLGHDTPAGQGPLVQGHFPWAGAAGAPHLDVSRRVPELLSLGDLLVLAAFGVSGAGLLAWLAVGRWARSHGRSIDAIAAAVDGYGGGQDDAPRRAAELERASAAADLELRRLGEGLAAMMRDLDRARAETAQALAHLAELNGTLEKRVTERTSELAVARDEALAAARTKEQILAGVSHELRTPLVGLLGSLELIDAAALNSEARKLLEVSRRSGLALRQVIDDVLDYSRLEAVGTELRELPFRADELAAEVVALHAAVALQKGLRLHCSCDVPAARPVRGDPVRLRQVLLNLVGNALKFTDHGHATLRLAGHDAPSAGRLALHFEVEDSGIGLSEEECRRLFSPFVQAGPGGAQARGGTGLGLAIAQRLVVAMGGEIRVRSQPGRGSSFFFDLQLPLADDAPAAAAAPAEGLLRGRVLVVEDNPVNRMIACEMLRRLGLQIEEAENGLLALEALRRNPADLVLMDYHMPVLDGPGATACIRAGEAGLGLRGVPIIAVTAHALKGDAEACLAAGMDDYLAKPFSQHELAAMLGRWLGRGVAPAASPARAGAP